MSGLHRILFFVIDFLLLNVSILASFYVHYNFSWEVDRISLIYLLIYSNLAWLFLVMVSKPYSITKSWTVSKIIRNQLAFIFIHLLVVASLVIFLNRNYSTFQVVLIYLIFTPLFFLFRILV